MARQRESGDWREALKRRMGNVDLGGGGREFFKPKIGTNRIRILPEVGDMEVFWQEVGRHYPPNSRNSFICPSFTVSRPCPICEFVDGLYRAGDPDSQALASKMRVAKQYWMNVIDRANEEKGPQIFTPGVMVFRFIYSLLSDPDYVDEDIGPLIVNAEKGLDITLTREGEGRENTKYDLTPRRNLTPLHKDPAVIKEWLERATDLSPVELTEDSSDDNSILRDEDGKVIAIVGIKPYERLKAEFDGLDFSTPETSSSDEEDEKLPFPDDGKPQRRAVASKRQQKDEGDDEDDEDEEGDDGATRVQNIIRRRRAR